MNTLGRLTPNSGGRGGNFQVMAKPAGPACNLACTYCFYLEKKNLFQDGRAFRMSDEVLEAFIRRYIESVDAPQVPFAWQGGEPTILGPEFFRKVVRLQQKFASGKTITNSIQTNGVLIDDEWAEFFAKHGFLVGISLDGPKRFHDAYRVDASGKGSFDRVMKGLRTLQSHQVEFNTLTVVNRKNARHPLDVYRFLKNVGSRFHQYIPLVERLPDARSTRLGLNLATPPRPDQESPVTEWSVEPEMYGRFLIKIFEEWVRRDVGEVFVQMFDNTLASWYGEEAQLCVFRETCGNALIIEHEGSIYSCDHFMYPEYRLGDIREKSLKEMVGSERQVKFGLQKRDGLTEQCRQCNLLFACRGGCPKHRFMKTPSGEYGLNYLCPAYKAFFDHVAPYMETMTRLLENRKPPAMIMEML